MRVTFLLTDGTKFEAEEGGYDFDSLRNELSNSEDALILVGYINSEKGLTQTLRRLKDVKEVIVHDAPLKKEEEKKVDSEE